MSVYISPAQQPCLSGSEPSEQRPTSLGANFMCATWEQTPSAKPKTKEIIIKEQHNILFFIQITLWLFISLAESNHHHLWDNTQIQNRPGL